MLDEALSLARRGWHVFPCCAWDQPKHAPPERRGKAPLIETGFRGATTGEAQIVRWWADWPNANIGVACGASGLVVVDVDGAEGWAQIKHGGYDLPETLTSRTGKPQGAHLIYRAGAHGIKTGTNVFGVDGGGVDIRAEGGYIIAPPSKHYSGKVYEFDDPDVEIADPPLWLVGLQRQRSGRLEAARKLIVDPDEMLREGGRNDGLFDIGCVFRRDNSIQDVELLTALLRAENQRRCSPPLDDAEVRRIAESAAKPLADEIVLPPDGWGSVLTGWAGMTGNATTMKKAEALRVEIEQRLPEVAHGRLALALVRYVSPGVDGGVFSATVGFRGREVTINGLTGDDLCNPRRVRARCMDEKLAITVPPAKTWNAMLEAAIADCLDIEVSLETTVVGACIEAIREYVADLAETDNIADFPAGKERFKLVHDNGDVSVHAATLRLSIERAIKDAKRPAITAALKALGATEWRPGGRSRMLRMQP